MYKRGWLQAFILVGVAVVLAGCSGADSTPAPATEAATSVEAVEAVQAESALANSAWQADSFGGLEDGIPVIPDTYPSLHFHA